MEDEIFRILDKLTKSIVFDDGRVYSLIINKNDWDGYDYSWIIMYAKENKKNFSSVNLQIKVEGKSFYKALQSMEEALDKFRVENKNNPHIIRM